MGLATDWRPTVAERPGRWSSVHVRTTVAAVLVVGVAFAVASVALVLFVEVSLTSQVRTLAEARAHEVAGSLDPGVADAEEEFVQVLGAAGEVIAASANVEGIGALAELDPGREGRLAEVPGKEGPFLVVAVPAEGGLTVLAGRGLDDVTEARNVVIAGLMVGVPLLVALVGLVTWTIVGRALRPVESMREEVERISLRALDRRLPEPGGGDEIGRLAVTLNRMLGRLEDAQTRQRRFVADASHELRSPVAAIRQHAEVAQAHPARTDVAHLTDVVLEEDARLQALVEDLLLLTRLDEGAGQRSTEQVDLDDLALAEAARLRAADGPDIDTRGVAAARVRGSRAQLERIVRNLGDNAVRHARSSVSIGLAASDGLVVLTVDDDGPGIDPRDRERAFERFVRLDEGRARDAGGAGLGLAIVREIVGAHGGEVALNDSPLGGLRAEVHLPAEGEAGAVQRGVRRGVASWGVDEQEDRDVQEGEVRVDRGGSPRRGDGRRRCRGGDGRR